MQVRLRQVLQLLGRQANLSNDLLCIKIIFRVHHILFGAIFCFLLLALIDHMVHLVSHHLLIHGVCINSVATFVLILIFLRAFSLRVPHHVVHLIINLLVMLYLLLHAAVARIDLPVHVRRKGEGLLEIALVLFVLLVHGHGHLLLILHLRRDLLQAPLFLVEVLLVLRVVGAAGASVVAHVLV